MADMDLVFEELDINGSIALYNTITDVLIVFETKVMDTTILPPYSGLIKYVFKSQGNGVPHTLCMSLPEFLKDYNLLVDLYKYTRYDGVTLPPQSSLPFAVMLTSYSKLRTKLQFQLPVVTGMAWNNYIRFMGKQVPHQQEGLAVSVPWPAK